MVFFGDKREAAEVKDEAFERRVLGRVDDESYTINSAFEQLGLDGGDGIGDPLADFGMTRLANAVVVLSGREERVAWVDVALVENGMDGNNQEVAEDADKGLESDNDICVVHVDECRSELMKVLNWYALGRRVWAGALDNLSRITNQKETTTHSTPAQT